MVKVDAGREAGRDGRDADGGAGVAGAMVWPAAVSPGDCIAVVAPSSPFDPGPFDRGLAWLRQRYRVKVADGVLARHGYLAGDDARRAAELGGAMTDPEVVAIVAARGGYGAMRILDALPWDGFARSPKWLVGFSDVTALHACAWARGIASIHAPNATGLGQEAPEVDVGSAWLRAVESRGDAASWEGLRVLHRGAGEASGTLVGGNLSLVQAMAAAGRLTLPQGCVLALEDVTERPYRIDRMLTALRLGGHLERVGAIVLGSFDQCDPGPDGVTVLEVLTERTRDLGIVVVAAAPFGHASPNEAFILGSTATVTAGDVGSVRMLQTPPPGSSGGGREGGHA
jgi:muramoyltetrapeptide carboxypeptidase